MTEELATRAFEYWGAFAIAMVFLMVALVWVVRRWVAAMERVEEMHAARLNAEREHAKIGEAMRDSMVANTTALQAAVRVMEARGRDGG